MDRSAEIFPHPLNDLPSAFQQERLDQFESPPCDPLAIFGRRRRMKFHNLQWAVGVYAGKFFAENLQCLLDSLFIRVPPGFCEFGYPGVVEAEAEIVGILRLVPPIESMGFHDKKVRQRNHPESDGVLSPCRSCSRESDGDRRTERKLAGIRLQHAKSGKFVSPFDFEVSAGQEVYLYGNGCHPIVQIDFADEPKFLVPAFEPPGFQKRFQQVRVKPAFEFPGIEGNIHINASDMDFRSRRQKEVGHPTSDNGH